MNHLLDHIQDYFEYITKHETETDPLIGIYVNKIENWITFIAKARYYLKFLALGTMKLTISANNKITK